MERKRFYGRVVTADRTAAALVLLAVCYLVGALLGHVVSRHSLHSEQMQAALAAFLLLVKGDALSQVSSPVLLFSYCKYILFSFALRFVRIGIFLIPLLAFYQGFVTSFAISSLIGISEGQGLVLALLLYGLRCGLVLPCFFVVAPEALCASVSLADGRTQDANRAVLCFILCLAVLCAGALAEWKVLPRLLHIMLS